MSGGVLVRAFMDADRDAWRAYAGAHKEATLFHDLRWSDAVRTGYGYASRHLVAERAGAIAGVAIRGAEIVVRGNIGSRSGQVMMRKAAKYWTMRSSMTVQAAMTTGMVTNVVSRISGREMPSMPRWSRRFPALLRANRRRCRRKCPRTASGCS